MYSCEHLACYFYKKNFKLFHYKRKKNKKHLKTHKMQMSLAEHAFNAFRFLISCRTRQASIEEAATM